MAELLIGALITVVVEKLASGDLIRLARSAKIESKLEKLTNNLTLIQAVLEDAGQKHITSTSEKTWLNQMQHLAYEIDDVVDDLNTEAKRSQLTHESSATTSKVLKFIPTKFHDMKYAHMMSSKLDEMTTKLDELVKRKKVLSLNQNVDRTSRVSRRLEETSLIVESKIIGRGGDKEALLQKLLGSESSSSQTQNFMVVSIVGLGGIGKTTLAQLLYNDKKVNEHFELKAWVCVSDTFDVYNITKIIFQAVSGENKDFADLNLLQVALSEKLSKKKFLLVLDDVWNENYNEWELLHRPFNVGAAGSKILVTSRKTKVASLMGSIQTYPLQLLSDEEALSLFAQYALGKPNFDSRPTIKLHGEGLVKKCDRLPLALRTLGRVLRTKSNDKEWEELLNSEFWDSQNGSEILPALRLSYYDLPQHLKQMFVYCCLFPKDYMFNKDKLVLLWMAEGFISQPNGENSMEIFGGKCFEELVSRSFFQHSTNKKSLYTMHDLINDLATSVAGEFFLRLDDKIDVYTKQEALEKVHHLSFICQPKNFEVLHRARRLRTLFAIPLGSKSFYISEQGLIELLPQLKFLRTLNLENCDIEEVPQSIGMLKHMRYLNFSESHINWLPEQVGNLHNLQSLLLSGCCYLSSLPNSIGKLVNLRHLDIARTQKLDKMPLGLCWLTCLQTLPRFIIGGPGSCRISDLKGLLHLRGRLCIEGLHKLKDAMHAEEAGIQLKKGICEMRMEWSDDFDNTRNEKTEYEVLKGLRPSEKLASLEIVYYGGTKLPSWLGDPSFDCLTQLELLYCRSCECLPTLGHLPSLQELFIKGMDGLKILDSKLLVSFDSWHGVAFPSLHVLKFEDMKSWEEWSTSGGDMAGAFPCLHQMSIINCPKLLSYNGPNSIEKFEIYNCKSLVSLRCWKEEHLGKESNTKVKIYKCPRLESYKCSNNIEKLEIYVCPSLTSMTLIPTMDNRPSTLRSIEIGDCYNMDETWLLNNNLTSVESLYYLRMPNISLFPEGCLVHLTSLTLKWCDNIESIPDNGYGYLPFLCLRELMIWKCKNLKSFPHEHLQNLTSLEVSECPCVDFPFPGYSWPPNLSVLSIGGLKKPISEWGMQNFPTSLVTLELSGGNSDSWVSFVAKAKEEEEEEDISSFILPSSLIKLEINNFKELESVSEGMQHLTCLQQLDIYHCPKLKDLPEALLPSLSSLLLYECSRELREKCSESRKGKYWPLISQIPDLDIGDI